MLFEISGKRDSGKHELEMRTEPTGRVIIYCVKHDRYLICFNPDGLIISGNSCISKERRTAEYQVE